MLLGLLTVGAGIVYAGSIADKDSDFSQKAQLKREKAVEYENNAYNRMKVSEEKAEFSMKKLFNIKKGIYLTSIQHMKQIFEPISTLSFLDSINSFIKEEKIEIASCLSQMEYMSNVYNLPMTKKQEILTICFGISGKQELAYASQQMKMARLVASQYDNKVLVLDTITKKNNIVWSLLKDLNIILVKSLEESNRNIQLHGNNEKEYTNDEIDNLRFTIQMADMICKICDSSLVNNDGQFNNDVSYLIEKGNNILLEANNQITTRRN